MTYLGDSSLRARLESLVRGWLEGAPKPRPPEREFLVIGHRGAPRLEAENTLSSYVRALEQGANAIEVDVCATRDGRFVLWHDADPDGAVALVRQAGGEGLLFRPDVPAVGSTLRRPVRQLSQEDLLAHYRYVRAEGDAPDGATSAREASIVTLPELFAWASGRERLSDVLLDIKLEEDQTAEAEALVDLLQDTLAADALPGITIRLLSPQAEIASALVERCRRLPPGDPIRVSADFELPGAPEMGPRTGARDVSLGCGQRLWPGFRRDVVKCVEGRDRGAFESVIAWTINDTDRLRELVRIGVDGILTDEVAMLREIVGAHAAPPAKKNASS